MKLKKIAALSTPKRPPALRFIKPNAAISTSFEIIFPKRLTAITANIKVNTKLIRLKYFVFSSKASLRNSAVISEKYKLT